MEGRRLFCSKCGEEREWVSGALNACTCGNRRFTTFRFVREDTVTPEGDTPWVLTDFDRRFLRALAIGLD